MRRDALPHPLAAIVGPVDNLVGIEHETLPNGDMAARLRPLERCLDGTGELAAGMLFMLADIVLARMSLNEVANDQQIATTHLHVDILSRPTLDTGLIGGRAHSNGHVDSGVRCRADLIDPSGAVMAVASGRFAVLGAGTAAAARVRNHPAVASIGPSGIRPIVGRGPIHDLLGFTLLGVSGQTARFGVVTGSELANDRGGVHGGIGALIGQQAATLALGIVAPSAAQMRPFDMRAVFVRPIEAGATAVSCDAEVTHVGRTFATSRASLRTPDGRLAVLVDVLHAPGQEFDGPL